MRTLSPLPPTCLLHAPYLPLTYPLLAPILHAGEHSPRFGYRLSDCFKYDFHMCLSTENPIAATSINLRYLTQKQKQKTQNNHCKCLRGVKWIGLVKDTTEN